MYVPSKVQSCLAGLIGFFQPDDPSYSEIDADLTSSSSGLFVQTTHPLCTIENLNEISPEFRSFTYSAWVSGKDYTQGARILASSVVYQAKQAIVGGTTNPATDTANWAKVNPFSEWLRRCYRQSCNNLINAIVTQKKIQSSGKSLLEAQQLYRGYGSLTDKIIKRDRFLGFELLVDAVDGLIFRIDKLGIQLDQIQDLTFYLYNSSQEEAVKTFDVNVGKRNTFSWSDLTDAIMGLMISNCDANSRWFFGYYETDLTGQAVGIDMNLSQAPCPTCDMFNIQAYNAWSKFTKINSIEVPVTALDDDRNLFDVSKVSKSNRSNWGMNLFLSVICDLSDISCRNKMILAPALASQICLDFLAQIAFNRRMNAISDKTKALAAAELDPNIKSGSFKSEFLDMLQGLQLDFSGLNSACMPCTTKGTITKRAI